MVEDEVDWKYEIGAWTRASYDSRRKPALLVANTRGYPRARMLTAVFTIPSRLALALGQPEATPLRDLARLFRQRVGHPIAPLLVQDGPVREGVLRGAEVHGLYPIVHFLRGRRGWPRRCEKPRELMHKVSARWRGA